ncbi:MAG: hypothetical protein WBO10_14310 [Pyrinomonadaceae bacterium]
MSKGIRQISDAELLAVAKQLVLAATGSEAAYGSTVGKVAAIGTLGDTFSDNLDDQADKAAQAKAATATKDGTREQLEDEISSFRNGAKLAGADDALMAATTIPVGGEKIPTSFTIPIATVDTSQRLRHTISWVEATTPENKRRPRGVQGAAIYRKLDGALPTDVNDCVFIALDTNSPYTVDYDGEDAGKMAHYMIRWQLRDGTFGALGETVSATITG